ncbi:MAG: hypothetical protein LBC82_09670 [Oscillospiraceae bacterium]|jgi:hypothetical protein|nr:hypothetical protein [Oscillospiraceae bacterium]
MLKLSKKRKAPESVTEALAAEVNAVESDVAAGEVSDKKPERRIGVAPKTTAAPKKKKPTPVQKEHKVINSLVGNLSHALEEDVSQIDEMLEDKGQPREYHDREKRPAKYRFFLILGLVVFWLAIVGALSVIQTVRELAFDISNQTALKEEFERFLFPVVVNDPPGFTEAENLPPSIIISSAIWHIILMGDTSNYNRDFGTMVIPENDVEAAVRGIFGSGFEIRHGSIDNIVITFIYESENKSYTVPENPAFFTFSPKVTEISNTGETYRLMVDYIAPTPQQIAGIEYEIHPVKTMVYTVNRSRDGTKVLQSIESIRLNREHDEFIYF